MSYEDADTRRENPNYKKGVNDGYNLNCQTCTVVHELRRRGFDVEALPNINNGSAHKTINWQQRFMNQDGTFATEKFIYEWKRGKGYENITTKRTLEFIQEQINVPGRYEVYVQWAKKKSAHVFLAEETSDEKLGIINIRFFDPQTGEYSKKFLDRIDKTRIGIMRVDDKKINPKVLGLIRGKL